MRSSVTSEEPRRPARTGVLIASAVVLTACVLTWADRGDWTTDVGGFLALYGTAFVAYLAALAAARGLGIRGLVAAVALAAAWRAVLAAAPPLLSDDVYRNVWEGCIQRHGGNPYAWDHRPDSERWTELRDGVWQAVNHKGYTAIYPPAWQLAMRAVSAIDDSVAAVKAFIAACDLLALWPLAVLLRRRGLPRERLLVLAWSPLAVVEGAGSGHSEPAGVLLLAAALVLMETRRPLGAMLALAVGAAVKLLPALIAIAWFRRLRWWHFLAGLTGATLLTLPYAGAGAGLWMSLGRYADEWRFNESLFAAVAALAGGHSAGVALATVILGLSALGLGIARAEPATAALVAVVLTLALSPNVLPWYALWLLPLLVVHSSPAPLLFTLTAATAYVAYPGWLSGERWHLSWGWRALEYVPCFAVAVLELRARRPPERLAGPAGAGREPAFL